MRSREKTYNKILFVGKHNIHCVNIISAIWLVYNEFVFLEWKTRKCEPHTTGKPKKVQVTHVFEEQLAPSLILPRQFTCAFQPDEEFTLKIEKFIEIRE